MRPLRLLIRLAAAVIAACGGKSAPAVGAAPAAGAAPSAAARAATLRAAAMQLKPVHGRRDDGGGPADYTGYFEGEQLRYLEEVLVLAGALLHNRYFFEDGALFYVSGERAAGASVGGGPTALAPNVELRAEFQGARTLAAVRLEHYGEVPLAASEVAAIRSRAALLAAAATDEWHARLRH